MTINEYRLLIRGKPCILCTNHGCDALWVKEPKDNGKKRPYNIIPMCKDCQKIRANIGMNKIFRQYWEVQSILRRLGWFLDGFDRLRNERDDHELPTTDVS